ncbi:MAG: zinc-dependent metalloprotease [Gemmatimonadaceae bacterium]
MSHSRVRPTASVLAPSLRSALVLGALATACVTPAGRTPASGTPSTAARAADAADANSAQSPATIAAKTRGMERRDGLIPLWLDDKTGKVFFEIPRDSMRVLLFQQLSTGLGSNPIGLDRGGGGSNDVARFERNGERVLVVLENWNYRNSQAGNAAISQGIAESFPPSTVASLPIAAEENGRLLVDATEFVYRDWQDVAGQLQRSNEGNYSLARDRSSIYKPYTRGFPDNTEIDVSATFVATGRPGNTVSRIVPDGRAFTLRQHLSFVRLPDEAYRPRTLDPRVSFFGIQFKDFAQPIQGMLEQRWINRARLERESPRDPNSPIKNPIVYYIDRGIPEPLHAATVEGAKFWEQAFDRAGLRGGFVVKDLPEGADPMDVRYNMVLWINRNERGWSFGGSTSDPRTGEIIKGIAHMDSHRNRTAYNIYAALMGADPSPADTHYVLGRVRQVTAHEIGHTLGMAHNYIASTDERSSVMDYPAPRVRLNGAGEIDVSKAYDLGPGEFDVFAVRWGYGIFSPENEADSLDAIVRDGLKRKLLFLSDGDARPDFASDPRTNLWDDAATATEFLKHQMDVRRVAMKKFGERNIRVGEPIGTLQERFVPLYMFHRWGINSAVKNIGGMEYQYAVRGDGQQATRPVGGAQQREALAALVASISPAELAIPDSVVTLLAPRPFGFSNSIELFESRVRPAFDELGTARTLAQFVIDGILQRDRAARLVQFAWRTERPLTLPEAITTLQRGTLNYLETRPGASQRDSAIVRMTTRALVDRLLMLAADKEASQDVRAISEMSLRQVAETARGRQSRGGLEYRAHLASLVTDINRWFERGELPAFTPALRAPPGDPFGEDDEEWWR